MRNGLGDGVDGLADGLRSLVPNTGRLRQVVVVDLMIVVLFEIGP